MLTTTTTGGLLLTLLGTVKLVSSCLLVQIIGIKLLVGPDFWDIRPFPELDTDAGVGWAVVNTDSGVGCGVG